MTPKQVIEKALGETFQDEDGNEFKLHMEPPLNDSEFERLNRKLGTLLPSEIRELLEFTRGFEWIGGYLDFKGRHAFEFEEAFPRGWPILNDGCGNFWVVDIHSESGNWSPIFFACHDPPVIAYQAKTLSEFLTAMFGQGRPPHRTALEQVSGREAMEIWKKNPGLLCVGELRSSQDPMIQAFISELNDDDHVADLRKEVTGSGFSWGRHGPKTKIRRYKSELLFAIEASSPEERGFFARLFGR